MRHLFTQKCFETLLQFSFVNDGDGDKANSSAVSQVAVATLLTRCATIISKYSQDVELKQNVPTPR